MRCREASELMSLRLDNQLETGSGEQLDQHLASCDTCAQLWMAMRRAGMLLARAPMVEPAAGFTARVMARLPERPVPSSHVWLGILALVFGAMAATVLFIGSAVVTLVVDGQWGLEVGGLTRGLIGVSWFVEQIRAVVLGIWLTGRVVSRAIPPTVAMLLGLTGMVSLLVWGVIVGRIRLAQTVVLAE